MTKLLERIRNKLSAWRSIPVTLSGLWNVCVYSTLHILSSTTLCSRQNNKSSIECHQCLGSPLMKKHLQVMKNTFCSHRKKKKKIHSCRQPSATPRLPLMKVTSALDRTIRLHDIAAALGMIKMVIHACSEQCLVCLR